MSLEPRKLVVKKKSTKNAFEGDILQACRLTDETIEEILEPRRARRKYSQVASHAEEAASDGSGRGLDQRLKSIPRHRLGEKPKTVSFFQQQPEVHEAIKAASRRQSVEHKAMAMDTSQVLTLASDGTSVSNLKSNKNSKAELTLGRPRASTMNATATHNSLFQADRNAALAQYAVQTVVSTLGNVVGRATGRNYDLVTDEPGVTSQATSLPPAKDRLSSTIAHLDVRQASLPGHSILKNSKNSQTNVLKAMHRQQFASIYDQLEKVQNASHVAQRLKNENMETMEFVKGIRDKLLKNQGPPKASYDRQKAKESARNAKLAQPLLKRANMNQDLQKALRRKQTLRQQEKSGPPTLLPPAPTKVVSQQVTLVTQENDNSHKTQMSSRLRHANRITSNVVRMQEPPTTERNSNRMLKINQLNAQAKGQSMEVLTAEGRPSKDLRLPGTYQGKKAHKLKGDSSPQVNACFQIFDNSNAVAGPAAVRSRIEQQVISKGSGQVDIVSMEILSAEETNRDSVKASTLHCHESTDRGNESNEAAEEARHHTSFVPTIANVRSDHKIIESGEVEEKQVRRAVMPQLTASIEPDTDKGFMHLEHNLTDAALSNKTASACQAGYMVAQDQQLMGCSAKEFVKSSKAIEIAAAQDCVKAVDTQGDCPFCRKPMEKAQISQLSTERTPPVKTGAPLVLAPKISGGPGAKLNYPLSKTVTNNTFQAQHQQALKDRKSSQQHSRQIGKTDLSSKKGEAGKHADLLLGRFTGAMGRQFDTSVLQPTPSNGVSTVQGAYNQVMSMEEVKYMNLQRLLKKAIQNNQLTDTQIKQPLSSRASKYKKANPMAIRLSSRKGQRLLKDITDFSIEQATLDQSSATSKLFSANPRSDSPIMSRHNAHMARAVGCHNHNHAEDRYETRDDDFTHSESGKYCLSNKLQIMNQDQVNSTDKLANPISKSQGHQNIRVVKKPQKTDIISQMTVNKNAIAAGSPIVNFFASPPSQSQRGHTQQATRHATKRSYNSELVQEALEARVHSQQRATHKHSQSKEHHQVGGKQTSSGPEGGEQKPNYFSVNVNMNLNVNVCVKPPSEQAKPDQPAQPYENQTNPFSHQTSAAGSHQYYFTNSGESNIPSIDQANERRNTQNMQRPKGKTRTSSRQTRTRQARDCMFLDEPINDDLLHKFDTTANLQSIGSDEGEALTRDKKLASMEALKNFTKDCCVAHRKSSIMQERRASRKSCISKNLSSDTSMRPVQTASSPSRQHITGVSMGSPYLPDNLVQSYLTQNQKPVKPQPTQKLSGAQPITTAIQNRFKTSVAPSAMADSLIRQGPMPLKTKAAHSIYSQPACSHLSHQKPAKKRVEASAGLKSNSRKPMVMEWIMQDNTIRPSLTMIQTDMHKPQTQGQAKRRKDTSAATSDNLLSPIYSKANGKNIKI